MTYLQAPEGLRNFLLLLMLLILLSVLSGGILCYSYRPSRRKQILRVLLMVLSFLFFSCLHGQVPGGPADWPVGLTALAILIQAVLAAVSLLRLLQWRESHILPSSIKEGLDWLPTGICFYRVGGGVILANRQMHRLCLIITGKVLKKGAVLWQTLTDGTAQPGCTRVESAETESYVLPDGSVWSFRRRRLQLGEQEVYALSAWDITQQHAVSQTLRAENEHLTALQARFREYGALADEVAREQELLRIKAQLHDDLGRALLSARHSMLSGSSREEREAVLSLWRQTSHLLGQKQNAQEQDNYHHLLEAAGMLGITVVTRGQLPEPGSRAMDLTCAILRTCMTNAFRHAGATELEMILQSGEKGLTVLARNNGRTPGEEIREGGGLSSLRRRIEGAGGSLTIDSQPRFLLKASIPMEGKQYG